MRGVLPALCKVPVAGDMGRGQGWQGGCCTVVTLVCAVVLRAGAGCERAGGHQGVFQHFYRSRVSPGSVVTSP